MARFSRPSCCLLVLGLCLLGGSEVDAQARRRPPVRYLDLSPPDQVEGARILEDMRDLSLGGVLPYQEFELRLLPRQGAERRLSGRWFGDRNDRGPITRIEISPGASDAQTLLVQNGPQPVVWSLGEDRPAERVEGEALLASLAGTNLSAADLLLPFMYWTEFAFEGRESFRGRPAYVFLLFPPASTPGAYPEIGGARIFIDTQFRFPLQVQWVDETGRALKTVSVIDLKKVADQWIVKSFEARDEKTRDKTRFVVTAVAFTATVPKELFTAEGPGGPASVEIPPASITAVR